MLVVTMSNDDDEDGDNDDDEDGDNDDERMVTMMRLMVTMRMVVSLGAQIERPLNRNVMMPTLTGSLST